MPPPQRARAVPLWALVAGIAVVAVVVIAAIFLLRRPEPSAVEVEASQSPLQPASGPAVPTATGTSASESEGPAVVLTEDQKRQIEQELEPDQAEPPESSEPSTGAPEPGIAQQPTASPPAGGTVTTRPRQQPPPVATRPSPATETPSPVPTAPPPAPSRRSASELWLEAERLKSTHSYHSLRAKLDELLTVDPYHADARQWRDKCPGWIREHEEDLSEEVRDRLEELADGIDDRDLEDVLELWGKRVDVATERYLENLFSRYKVLKARYALERLNVHDGAANFTARIVIEGKSQKGRKVPFETVFNRNWNGQVFDDGDRKRFSRSFP